MKREDVMKAVEGTSQLWDVIVVGGGATGLGAAVEAASRKYKTLLVEQADFAKGTSSRSTKLVHGGVRYLPQGQISLVIEALHERGLLIQNAPHLVHNQPFIVPSYEWWEGPFYDIGLKVYDMLAGKLGLGPSRKLSREETLKRIPTVEPEGLRGGIIYYDGQFDDARLATNLAQTLVDLGGFPVNYMKMTGLLKSNGFVNGIMTTDMETGKKYEIPARVVVNATGVFSDSVLKMDDPDSDRMISPSQGVHLVLEKEFLPGDSAIMVPHTSDGRVLFAVPWHNKVVVGTTDTPVDEPKLEPRALESEVDFILEHAARYLSKDPSHSDVLSVFAGLRPLIRSGNGKDTSSISRDHSVIVSASGLVTVIGGKWTTYRKMGEDTIDKAAIISGLQERDSVTEDMRIHGWLKNVNRRDPLHLYGSDAIFISKLIKNRPELGEKIHPRLPYLKVEVIWAVRNEMARNVEDVLARRMRALLLDARTSIEMAHSVASLMAEEMHKDRNWIDRQVNDFTELASGYILN